ncbi:MAG TPA: phytoene/squalene synthase family protein [Gemmatimonadaceae bacterium]|jgi:farnesyl-diphosphate farnesyltransferase|nr:phytoene/squalene synthase family protein [Gemmatimonadaceae bacterium]
MSAAAAELDSPKRLRYAARFATAVLPEVSRTFAISIRFLPGVLGRAVMTAYLLCRIADTIEDDGSASPERKADLLDAFLRSLGDRDAAEAFPALAADIEGDPAHVDLLRHTDLVCALLRSLPDHTRNRVVHWVGVMVHGMRKFVQLYPRGIRIQTVAEYREYCYYVAGTVGCMLTELWYEHAPSVGKPEFTKLWTKCRQFGEALQTVNILKDIAWDAEHENAIYIPQTSLQEHGSSHQTLLDAAHLEGNHAAVASFIALAWTDLDDALEYILMVPRRAVAIRAFCILPLLFAYATLRDLSASRAMLSRGGSVKITRVEVRSLTVAGLLSLGSNRALRSLVDRVRVRRFVPFGAAT